MLYFVYGDDHFRVREQVDLLKEAARRTGVEVVLIDAAAADWPSLRDVAQTGSLFATKRALFVKNLLTAGSSDVKEKVSGLLSTLDPATSLVFWEEGVPDRRLKLFQLLTRRAKTVEKRPLEGRGTLSWLKEQAQKKKVVMDSRAQELLVGLIGNDLDRLDNELEKLSLFAGRKIVREHDILAFVDAAAVPGIFELLDAWGKKEERASLLVEQLLRGGEEPLYLLSMLAYQLRNLLLVADLVDHDPATQPAEIARKLGLHPYVSQKIFSQAKTYTVTELRELHRRLTEADAAIKTGGLDASDALIMLVAARP